MKIISSTLDSFLANAKINKPGNDRIFTDFIGRNPRVLQFRLGAEEARNLAKALKSLHPIDQRARLHEMAARQGVGGMSNPGKIALISKEAAHALNTMARHLGIGSPFRVITEKALVPLSLVRNAE